MEVYRLRPSPAVDNVRYSLGKLVGFQNLEHMTRLRSLPLTESF